MNVKIFTMKGCSYCDKLKQQLTENKIEYFEIDVDESDQAKAEKNIDEMCRKLLVNLIIEDYKINKL